MRASFQGNISELTTLRFPFAILIAIYHYTNYFSDYETTGFVALERLSFVLDFFFILSGFVLAHIYNDSGRFNYRKYILRRFFRIYPLHIVTLFSLILIFMVGSAMGIEASHPERYQSDTIWMHLLMVQAWPIDPVISFNVPSWSISAEWFVYLTFPAFLAMRELKRPNLLFAFAIALTVFWYVFTIATTGYSYSDLEGYALARVVIGFILGFALREWLREYRMPFTSFKGASSILAIAMASSGLLGLPAVFSIGVFIFFMCAAFERSMAGTKHPYFDNPFWIKLGDTAFALYLIHMPYAIYMNNLIELGTGITLPGPSSDPAVFGVFAFLTLSSIPVAWVAHQFFEQPIAMLAPRFVETSLARFSKTKKPTQLQKQ